MSNNPFQKATKKQAFLRLALTGPSGAGKTYTALTLAKWLVPGGKVAVIDTEHGSASKYADIFEFDTLELTNFAPATYMRAIQAAQENGYDVLIIDSLSHAWFAPGGVLAIVDDEAARSKSGNTFMAWRKGSDIQNQLVEAILSTKMHVIATMRSKTEYAQERDDKTGKTIIRKLGTAPIQRDNVEYEFDVVGEMTSENTMLVQKSRCSTLTGAVIELPGQDVADLLRAWLTDGAPVEDTTNAPKAEPPTPTPPNNPRRIPAPTPNARAAQEAPAVPPQAAQEGTQAVQPAANGGNGPVSHQDGQGTKWAQDKRNIRALMGKAEILWADEKLPAPRVINRMALAWGLNGTASSDFNKLCELAAAQVTFSQDDAWKRIQTYTPGSDTSDEPPMCECGKGTPSGEGPYPELCIRCANERANAEAASQ